MRPGRLGSLTGGCGGAGGPWGIVCGREGLSKSSYSREGFRMRLLELVCWSIPPVDNPTRELKSGRQNENVVFWFNNKVCPAETKIYLTIKVK